MDRKRVSRYDVLQKSADNWYVDKICEELVHCDWDFKKLPLEAKANLVFLAKFRGLIAVAEFFDIPWKVLHKWLGMFMNCSVMLKSDIQLRKSLNLVNQPRECLMEQKIMCRTHDNKCPVMLPATSVKKNWKGNAATLRKNPVHIPKYAMLNFRLNKYMAMNKLGQYFMAKYEKANQSKVLSKKVKTQNKNVCQLRKNKLSLRKHQICQKNTVTLHARYRSMDNFPHFQNGCKIHGANMKSGQYASFHNNKNRNLQRDEEANDTNIESTNSYESASLETVDTDILHGFSTVAEESEAIGENIINKINSDQIMCIKEEVGENSDGVFLKTVTSCTDTNVKGNRIDVCLNNENYHLISSDCNMVRNGNVYQNSHNGTSRFGASVNYSVCSPDKVRSLAAKNEVLDKQEPEIKRCTAVYNKQFRENMSNKESCTQSCNSPEKIKTEPKTDMTLVSHTNDCPEEVIVTQLHRSDITLPGDKTNSVNLDCVDTLSNSNERNMDNEELTFTLKLVNKAKQYVLAFASIHGEEYASDVLDIPKTTLQYWRERKI